MRNHSPFVAASSAVIGFLIAFTIGIAPGHCQTLHVISAADTQDPQMGVEFKLNSKEIHNYVTSLSKTINLELDLIEIEEGAYSCASIGTAIKNLSVKPDDVILFFHSGHGNSPRLDANDKSASIFPSLECASALGAPIPNLEDISNELRAKGAGLTIVGADSCNNFVSVPPTKFAPAFIASHRMRTMFLNYRGYILVSSSSPGEFSFYADRSTGLFTSQLLGVLKNPPNVAPNSIWEQVIARATVPISVPPHQSPPQDKQRPLHREELRYLPPS